MDQDRAESTLPHRTLEYLRRGWKISRRRPLSGLHGNVRDDLPAEDWRRLAKQIDECLEVLERCSARQEPLMRPHLPGGSQ